MWGERLGRARRDYATVANAIADHEPVLMLARRAGRRRRPARRAPPPCEVVEMPLDDSWLRDSGPIFVRDAARRRSAGVDFVFNAWGEKFLPYDDDARLAERLLEMLGVPRRDVPARARGRRDHRRRRGDADHDRVGAAEPQPQSDRDARGDRGDPRRRARRREGDLAGRRARRGPRHRRARRQRLSLPVARTRHRADGDRPSEPELRAPRRQPRAAAGLDRRARPAARGARAAHSCPT